MTKGRLDGYMCLYLWEGGISTVGWQNFLDGRWSYLSVNCVLLAAMVVIHVVMRTRDRERGQIVERQSTPVPDREEEWR